MPFVFLTHSKTRLPNSIILCNFFFFFLWNGTSGVPTTSKHTRRSCPKLFPNFFLTTNKSRKSPNPFSIEKTYETSKNKLAQEDFKAEASFFFFFFQNNKVCLSPNQVK
jgi:hypothetical protein